MEGVLASVAQFDNDIRSDRTRAGMAAALKMGRQGRGPALTPHLRSRPDFPLRGFVRCHSCGRGLTASWSRSRNRDNRYAYYHCRSGPCRLTNVAKSKLEGLFAEALEQLQPTPGYMRLVTETILGVWRQQKAATD